jgi:glycosyltransferase involved in cell wall biosynthesis
MGGFQPNKGIWHVLDAAATLLERGLVFELHVWGPGQDAGRQELRARGIERSVILRGMYAPDELWTVYGEIDVAVIATTVPEPFGRIPIEAAASGAPTIGARIGGIPESIRHDVNGLLYAFRDVADLSRQMQRILEEPALYERLREGLAPPVDTRTVGPDVEAVCRRAVAEFQSASRNASATGERSGDGTC